jgi:type IV pilus assembly protein PilE
MRECSVRSFETNRSGAGVTMKRIQLSNFKFMRGFTLIEFMVVVAIVGILAAIALPSYADYIRKSRRADGIAAIGNLALAQEKWRANHTTYGTLNDLGLPIGEHYTLTIDEISATTYRIIATPQGDQQNDTTCFQFVFSVAGGTPTLSNVYNSVPPVDVPDAISARCWSR